MKKMFIFLFLATFWFPGHATALDLDEAAKAAENMERLVFAASPNARNLISYIDTHIKDGHLIVMVKKPLFQADQTAKDEVFNSIKNIWKETKYVREKGYAGWVEAKFWDEAKLEKIIIGRYIDLPGPQKKQNRSSSAPVKSAKRKNMITQKEFGVKWPFIVAGGRLECLNGDEVVLRVNGKTYALNGWAQNKVGVDGYENLDEIWRPNPNAPSKKMPVMDFISLGLKLCK